MPERPPPIMGPGNDPITAAFRDVWNAFRGLFRARYRIVYIDDFGYVAQVFDADMMAWAGIRPSGCSGLTHPNFLMFKDNYACRTEAEARARINRREAEHRVVWEG